LTATMVIPRLMAQVVRLKMELQCKETIQSPDYVQGCKDTLQAMLEEIEKREAEVKAVG